MVQGQSYFIMITDFISVSFVCFGVLCVSFFFTQLPGIKGAFCFLTLAILTVTYYLFCFKIYPEFSGYMVAFLIVLLISIVVNIMMWVKYPKEMNTIVHAKGKRLAFRGKLHRAKSLSKLQLEEAFYTKWRTTKDLPSSFPHYEVEIAYLPNSLDKDKLHIHKSLKNQKDFMCWTCDVPSRKYARAVFTLWCIGTSYTILTGEDFASLVKDIDPHIKNKKQLAEQLQKIRDDIKFFRETHQIYVICDT